LAILSEFDFEIEYIKGKENKAVDALSRGIQVNNLEAIISYKIDLVERVKNAGQHYEKY